MTTIVDQLKKFEIVVADAMKMENDPSKFWVMVEIVTDAEYAITKAARGLEWEEWCETTTEIRNIKRPYTEFLNRVVYK